MRIQGTAGAWKRLRTLRPHRAWVAAGAAVVVVAAIAGAVITAAGGPGTRTIKAEFTETPGLYVGNRVDVLGIPVGTVTAIKPAPGYTLVTMRVNRSVPLPADAQAVLMAPEVVSDRFVQLGPPYSKGPRLAPGSVIPVSRTLIPQSVDQVIGTLNYLATQLGPTGANRNGALSSLVHQLAQNLGGNGQDFHNAVVNFSQALGGLAGNSGALAGTLTNLGGLSQALAANSSAYENFAANLQSVSSVLAQDQQDIPRVIDALQNLFANLTGFIQRNGTTLGASIQNLQQFAAALSSQQQALAQAYDLAPLALENIANAVDKNAPGGPAIRGRYDAVGSTQTLFKQVCGDASLRFLVILATGTETNPLTTADSTDTLCAVGNALNALTPPPGSSPGPNLTLQALVP